MVVSPVFHDGGHATLDANNSGFTGSATFNHDNVAATAHAGSDYHGHNNFGGDVTYHGEGFSVGGGASFGSGNHNNFGAHATWVW